VRSAGRSLSCPTHSSALPYTFPCSPSFDFCTRIVTIGASVFVRQLTNARSRQALSFAGIRVSAACARGILADYSSVAKASLLRYRIRRSVHDIRIMQAKGSQCQFPIIPRVSRARSSHRLGKLRASSRPSFPINSPSQAGRDRRRKGEVVRLREAQSRQANSVGGRHCRQGIESDKKGCRHEPEHAHH
jgi:hypothetical protein